MTRHVVLLRGVNVGSRNRAAMPELRRTLAEAGFDDVETYLQSGNAVVGSAATPAQIAAQVAELLADALGLASGARVSRPRSRPRHPA